MTRDRYRRMVKAGLGLIALPLLISVFAFAQGSQAPVLAPAKGKGCVRPGGTMRYTHMTYLKDLRDSVTRSEGHSLADDLKLTGMQSCSECHADRAAFCDQCHTRAGVNLDCYGCHKY